MVNIVSTSRYPVGKKRIRVIVQNELERAKISPDVTLNIVFIGRRKMKDISQQYKNENEALPVLSFSYTQESSIQSVIPVGEGETLIGEVLICYPQAILLAAQRNRAVDKVIDELVLHGVKNIVTK